MEWWRWVLGGTAALLVLAILALRFDTLKEAPGTTPPMALRTLAPYSVLVPAAFFLALLAPWWIGVIVIAIPGLALLAMAAAS